jgi:hypothetical protein
MTMPRLLWPARTILCLSGHRAELHFEGELPGRRPEAVASAEAPVDRPVRPEPGEDREVAPGDAELGVDRPGDEDPSVRLEGDGGDLRDARPAAAFFGVRARDEAFEADLRRPVLAEAPVEASVGPVARDQERLGVAAGGKDPARRVDRDSTRRQAGRQVVSADGAAV